MALEEFEKEHMTDREKNSLRMHRITNYTMGVFFIVAGFFFMFPIKRYTAPFIEKYDTASIKMMAIICWVYGIFRLYRGYNKNFYRR